MHCGPNSIPRSMGRFHSSRGILIATKIQSKREEEIKLDINGRIYLVRVSEQSSSHLPYSIPPFSKHVEGIQVCPTLFETPRVVPSMVSKYKEEDEEVDASLDGEAYVCPTVFKK